MTERHRFLATMNYQGRDRCPICDFGFWPETLTAWHAQGLPEWVDAPHYETEATSEYFGMDNYTGGAWVNNDLNPAFESVVLKDLGDQELVLNQDGVQEIHHKVMSSIPMHVGHLLQDGASWREHFQPRLIPGQPTRLPQDEDWDRAVANWTDPDRETCATLNAGSLYGRIRDWMGVEGVSMLVYDEPDVFEEMVETLCQIAEANLQAVFATGAVIDGVHFWEDMCYSGGPLLSPAIFREVLVPRYRRLTDLCRQHGVEIIWVDCDGKIDALLPMWLDAGVNTMFPLEVGTWGADPVQYRMEYGRELRMMGGFDKHILCTDAAAIRAEVERLAPLVEEGGFIPFADHRVPPNVPLQNYITYLEHAREIWGRGTHLKPFRPERAPTEAS